MGEGGEEKGRGEEKSVKKGDNFKSIYIYIQILILNLKRLLFFSVKKNVFCTFDLLKKYVLGKFTKI